MPDTRAQARDTRTEILGVAAELFTERGYDATSLREISERLGITKAALYYHFNSKDEILRALVEPMTEVIGELLARLEAARDVDGWADALSWLIGTILDNIESFRLIERNRGSIKALHDAVPELDDRMEMRERVQAAVSAASASIEEEIRMFAALGAVTAFDDWAPKLLADGPPDVIQRELRAAVDAILRG